MNDLFQVEPSLSPRLRWMAEHSIKVIDNGPDVQMESEGREWREYRYCAHDREKSQRSFGFDCAGFGDTEEEAIVDFCKKQGIKLWNEV